MGKALTPEQVERYEREGMLFPVPVLSPAEVARFRAAIEEMEARLGGRLRRMDHCQLFFPWACELATHPAVLDVVEDLLGPDLFVHSTRIFSKPPHDSSFVSWHQDGTYSSLNSKPAPSIWIALAESTVENGCVRVIPGSHRQTKLPHVETFAADNLLNHGETIAIEVDESQAVDMVLRAGEMSIHHVNLIHGSNPNRSATRRLGFAITFIPPTSGEFKLPVLHARGRRDGGHQFRIAEPPRLELDEALSAHAAYLRANSQPAIKIAAA